MAKKRSFFERLTGGVSVHDDDVSVEMRLGNNAPDNWLAEETEGELAVDVHQTSSEIVIQTFVSGVKPEDLQIAITREMVTIKGRRELAREISPENYFQNYDSGADGDNMLGLHFD